MIYTRDEAAKLVELFENVLDRHNIIVPDDDRVGDEGEACLYGMTYWELLYQVEEKLTELLERADSEAIITQEFSGGR